MLFHKKEMEKLKDANICLRQQVHDLSRRIEGCENDCRKLADICSENGCLKEQLEKSACMDRIDFPYHQKILKKE